ncbi:MAG: DNA-processing protein DprA [Actinobacteria bacterium]|nr:DNA-processing protein DprA [Actinomycetota bacterium]
MENNEINLNILKLFYNLKIKPSDFINIYKNNKNIEETLDYFLKNKKNSPKLFNDKNNNFFQTEKDLNLLMQYFFKNAVFILNINQKEYPEFLREIYFPPPILFCKGEKIKDTDNLKIAIVGTRNCSDYGKEVAAYLSKELSKIGFIVVSGMALGIDAEAHKAAIKESGGSIGVLGTGIDIQYPYENKNLFEEIIKNGSLVTEFLPKTQPLKNNFPARNRIISGMSIGVIVVEAGDKSGAIVTAKTAIKENREVFAVPGNIFSEKSKGCHSLIKCGAKLVEDVDDILEEFKNYIKDPVYNKSLNFNINNNNDDDNFKLDYFKKNYFFENKSKDKKNKSLNNIRNLINFSDDDYLKIYNCVGYKEKSLEEIISSSGLGIKKVLQILSFFQLKNVIKEKNFNNFIKVS